MKVTVTNAQDETVYQQIAEGTNTSKLIGHCMSCKEPEEGASVFFITKIEASGHNMTFRSGTPDVLAMVKIVNGIPFRKQGGA
jgi:hypothetical protein